MAGPLLEPIPVHTPPISGVNGVFTAPWIDWLTLQLVGRVQQAAPVLPKVAKAAQTAALGTTALVVSASGYYRISLYARITVPASVSSSLNISLLFTDGGVAQTFTPLAAQTGNTTGSLLVWSGVIRADPGTPISFSTAYASVGTAMAYDCTVIPEGPL